MTYSEWLRGAERKLGNFEIGTARLDSLILLEFVTGRDRAWILAHPDEQIQSKALTKLGNLLTRRTRHEPIAYLRGFSEFYGHNFLITPAVLEPRPESETMIERLKWLSDEKNDGTKGKKTWRIADVGCGSGALGISAQLLLPNSQIELIDIDKKALQVAKRNVDLFTLNISVINSDLLASASDNLDILLCNLPYIPDNFHINKAAMQEPAIAIFGGRDGLDLYRKLFDQAKNRPLKPLYIFTESLPPQHNELHNIASDADYEKVVEDDFVVLYKNINPND